MLGMWCENFGGLISPKDCPEDTGCEECEKYKNREGKKMSKDLFKDKDMLEFQNDVLICDRDKPMKEGIVGHISADYADEIVFKKDIEQLLSAAKRALTYFKGTPGYPEDEPNPIEENLKAAIAKAEKQEG